MNYKLLDIGNIKLDDLDDGYSGELKFDNRKIPLYLDFHDYEKTQIDNLKAVENIVEKIHNIDEQNKKFYFTDFNNGGEAKSHVEFYFEEFEEEEDELMKIIDTNQPMESQELEFLTKFELVGIGMCPALTLIKGNAFATFDYSIKIDGEFSNQLLVVRTDYLGNPFDVDWES